MTDFIKQPDGRFRLGDFLRENLRNKDWDFFRAAVAFVKRSGTGHIVEDLEAFHQRATVRIVAGIDHRGTSKEGLEDLIASVPSAGSIWVFHNEAYSTFHPKLYLFNNAKRAVLCVGSGNLTEGGLYTNYEASLVQSLDLQDASDRALYDGAVTAIDGWTNPDSGTAKELTAELLAGLVADGSVPPESKTRTEDESEKGRETTGPRPRAVTFASVTIQRAPNVQRRRAKTSPESTRQPAPPAAADVAARGFLMTLQQTDVGVGQLTRGTSRRSPEIFIPLAARDFDPEFWGWDDLFSRDKSNPGKMDRRGVRMRMGTTVIEVNMMTWPAKHDFRLRSESLRSAGHVGDILRIEKPTSGQHFDYYAEVIPQGTSLYDQYLALCVHDVKNSAKKWGYY